MAWPPTNGDVLDALAAVRRREAFEPRADDCDHDNADEWEAARRDEPASGWLLLNLALVVNATPATADQTVWPMHVLDPYASLIANGSKTVEIRAAYSSRHNLTVGHLITFNTDPTIPTILARVQRVTRYPTMAQLLDREDPATIAGPGATREDVAALLGSIYPQPVPGYLAIEIRVIDPTAEQVTATRVPAISPSRSPWSSESTDR